MTVDPDHLPWRSDVIARARVLSARRRHRLGPLLEWLYRYPRLRPACVRWSVRLEGGLRMSSQTVRNILSRYHGISVGDWSYGPILRMDTLPRGSRVGGLLFGWK